MAQQRPCSAQLGQNIPGIRRICVIGAGPAGICAARECLKHYTTSTTQTPDIVVYEQRPTLGGVWSMENSSFKSNDAEECTGMYAHLVTNIPKEIVFFDDAPDYPSHVEASFISRQQMLDYFTEYAKPIVEMIRFNTKVLEVSRVEDKWRVAVETSSNTRTPIRESSDFDAVFVCNGHHNEPRIPAFAVKYKRPALHSKFYRRAEDYRDCTVAVLGAGPSGLDLTVQLGDVAKKTCLKGNNMFYPFKVYLLHRNPSPTNTSFGPLRDNCFERQAVVDASADSLLLADGSELSGLDYVIYCTGYNYSFPFFHAKSGSSDERRALVTTPDNATRVSGPLYAHVAHADSLDSLFFIGLNFKFLPLLVIQWQVRLSIALMTHRVQLQRGDAVDYERDRLAKLSTAGKPSKSYHQLADEIFDYVDHLAASCGCNGSASPPYKPVTRAIREHAFKNLRHNFREFKSLRYKVINDEEFVVLNREE